MKIRIQSVKQFFLIDAVMTIKLNGIEKAWLGLGDEITIDAPEGENVIHFSASIRSREIRFRSTNDVFIQTKWNSWGQIEARVTGDDVEVL